MLIEPVAVDDFVFEKVNFRLKNDRRVHRISDVSNIGTH